MRALGELDRTAAAAASSDATAAPVPDRLTWAGLAAILVGATLLNRFGLDMPAGGSIALTLPITLGSLALLLVCGRVELNVGRLILYMLMAATLALVTTVGPKMFSPNSFALLLVLYACFVLQLAPDRMGYRDVLRLFQNVVLICSVAGIAQFLGQFIIPGPYLFVFDYFVPDLFLMDGFNTLIPLHWGSPLYKSNGFFLLEPSHFSQISALAIVIELLFFERKWRLIVYGTGLLFTYSGTGLLLLVWALPVIFIMRRQFWLLWLGMAALAVMLAFAEALNIGIFADRIGEFGSRRSSGFARFIAPWLLLGEYAVNDMTSFLFGKGPGTYIHYSRGIHAIWSGFEPHDPTWAKLTFEYGIIGFAVFLVFALYCLFADSPSRFVALALLFGYLSFGGMLLKIHYHALMLVLAVLPVREAEIWALARSEAGGAAPAPPQPPPVRGNLAGGGRAQLPPPNPGGLPPRRA